MRLIFWLLFHLSVSSYSQTLVKLDAGVNTSLRGLSVLITDIAWASGSNGWVARTTNGSKTWKWEQIANYITCDFRDIEAFSANEAVVVNAGSPAVILKTEDGGKSWKETYTNRHPDIFIDGLSFADRKGIAFGDPINHKLQILRTFDGGSSWEDISANLKESLSNGEAAFAASGTSIKVLNNKVWIATGGTKSHIFFSSDFGQNWNVFDCPIVQGKNSTGIFSLDFLNSRLGVVVGGDYKIDTLRTNNMLSTSTGGREWQLPLLSPLGYRSAVCYIRRKMLIATGTSGTDISQDGGKTWKKLAVKGFNCVSKSKKGNLILFAGSNGEIYTLSQ